MPKVKLFANLRNLAGEKEASISGASVGAVLTELVSRYPTLTEKLFLDGQIRPHVIITVNGHPISDFNTPVSEQDEISIFPPLAGG
jgi:sulfur-carrier protein